MSKGLDWKKCKPFKKWVMVKADPRVKQTKGGIVLTESITGIERVMEGTGRVIDVGSQVEKALGLPLKKGDRICYRGFLKDAFQDFGTDDDGCAVFLLLADDVLAIIDDDVQMGAFS